MSQNLRPLPQIEGNKNSNHSLMVTINKRFKDKEEVDLKRQRMNTVQTTSSQSLPLMHLKMMLRSHHSEEAGETRTLTTIRLNHLI